MASWEGQVEVRVVIVRDLRGVGESGERRDHVASHSKSRPKRNHQEPESPDGAAQLPPSMTHAMPAWTLCVEAWQAPWFLPDSCWQCMPWVEKTEVGSRGIVVMGKLWIVMEGIALAESSSRACQLLGIRDTLTPSSSTNLNACPGSPNQR